MTLDGDVVGMTQTPIRLKAADHRTLIVWPMAMELATFIDSTPRRSPAIERFGLSSSLRRRAGSVPASIAEGNGRIHRRASRTHFSIARGSLRETCTLFELAKRIGYASLEAQETAETLSHQVGRLLTRLITVLRRSC